MPSVWAQAQLPSQSYGGTGAQGATSYADPNSCSGSECNGMPGGPGPNLTQTINGLDIKATGPSAVAVTTSGGNGGNGADGNVSGGNHWGGNGGNAGSLNFTIQNSTMSGGAAGVSATANGGQAGNWGGNNADNNDNAYGNGGSANAATLAVSGSTIMSGATGISVTTQGANGVANAEASWGGYNKSPGNGGAGGNVTFITDPRNPFAPPKIVVTGATVNLTDTTVETTNADNGARAPVTDTTNAGVKALSTGGSGGAADYGGESGHNTAGSGSDGGTIVVTTRGGRITTHAANTPGILARARGGDAGYVPAGQEPGSRAANGGTGWLATVVNGSAITTFGNGSAAIVVQSLGGNGGNDGGVVVGSGHSGGDGGAALSASVTNSGALSTVGNFASGIMASVVGGVGGAGSSASFSGHGGKGGSGGQLSGGNDIVISNSGSISTSGDFSFGVVAHAVGGGGGEGGGANGAVVVGGAGGSGGDGSNMTIANTGYVQTTGDHSLGLLLQSIGGGGTGGSADSTGVFVSAAAGGQGGSAGSGGNIAAATSSGTIATKGASSAGVLLQSIGGGGGRAGSADGVGVGIGLNVTVVTGGNGGGAGNGGIVQFDQQKGGSISTEGPQSAGILAQAIGGGGGDGGYARSRTITIAPPTGDNPSGTVSISVTHGGNAGSGGAGGIPDIANSGKIATAGAQSNGITAQSIGGGGGNGGGVLAPIQTPAVGPSNLNVSVTVRQGGNGGNGGDGDWVRVQNLNGGDIATGGSGSVGVLAQSIGGGGGNGGVVQQHDADSFNAIVGSPTAFLGAAKTVAEYLENVPNTLKWDKKINASVAVTLGGSGGTGGNADKFIVRNDGIIATQGNHASGIVAQSVGGGGGTAGAIDSSAASSLLSSIDGLAQAIAKGAGNLFTLGLPALNPTVQIGGSGGSFGAGGGSDQDPSLVTNTGKISTRGVASAGIVAQSIGGGGGNSMVDAQSVEDAIKKAAGAQAPDIIGWVTKVINLLGTKGGSVISDKLNVRVGGSGFVDLLGANGGTVVVDASAITSDIRTQGAQSPGILAQSIGGGGGVSATNHALMSPGSTGSQLNMGASGFFRLSGISPPLSGGNLTVTNGGSIATQGIDSVGILAQSIGGGGGVSTVNMLGTGTVVSAQSAAHSLTLGGEFAAFSNGFSALPAAAGGNVTVANTGQIATFGTLSHAILAQSIGGGGGTAVVSTNAGTATIEATLGARPRTDINVNQGVVGSGGAVNVSSGGGAIKTTGDLAFGMMAQSIGGGGGYVAADNGSRAGSPPIKLTFGSTDSIAGTGGTVNATLDAYGSILTTGQNAFGIVAQSIGGGGGIAGLTTRPGLVTLQSISSPNTVLSHPNDGGAVTVTVAGATQTKGNGAIGVLAQSIGGGGGIAGDSSAAQYGGAMIGNAGLTASTGNGGAVTVNVDSGGSVQTFGANAPAIYAMSVGGGGVLKDGAFYQYNTPGNWPTYGGPVTVNLRSNSTVEARGTNAPAIVAFSNGAYGGSGGIWINIDKTASVLANIDSGIGILAPMGITVNNDGLIQAKTAISAAQAVVINNNGTIQGDVVLTGNGTVNNNASGNLATGALFHGTLNNQGALSPGAGAFQTTRIEGAFNQTASGVYTPDLDFATGRSDFISVSGPTTFGGKIEPFLHNPVKNVWMGIAHFDQAPAAGVAPTLVSSPLFSFTMKDHYGGAQDPLVSVDFKSSAFAMSQDRSNVAAHLQALWDIADSRSASLFDRFVGVQSAQQYQQALDAIAHDGKFARSANQVHESYAAMNRMMSCPAFVGGGSLLRESDCAWGRINTNWVERGGTANDTGYRIRQTTLQFGAQKEFLADWFAAASFSYGFGNVSSPGVSGTNDAFTGGMAVKYNRGPWQLAAAIHGGFDTTDMRRQTFGATATSRPESAFVAGRLRAAYEFDKNTWYARPYVDLDVNHVGMFGYREHGANVFNLDVLGNSTTSFMISPMVEIGGRTALADGTLRSYIALGASFLSGGDVTTSMRLGEFNLAPFSVTTGMPTTYGNLSAGLELVTLKGIEIKAEYGLRAASHYVDQSLAIRAAYRF
ncbi:MAG: hypothetical protein ACTHNN_16935 [Xanthobacteraceae bacterium]